MVAQDVTYDPLIRSAARRMASQQRRLFLAEITIDLCDGNPRRAERRFGWGRETIRKGMQELQSGTTAEDNFSARGRPRAEDKDPQLASDIREIVEPHSQADPEMKSTRCYTNMTAAEVRKALIDQKNYASEDLPAERTFRDILNRVNYRLNPIRKSKPLKKTADTDAIFENIKAVKAEARSDPSTLEVSIDTKAKVALGDYSRGGKKPDGF